VLTFYGPTSKAIDPLVSIPRAPLERTETSLSYVIDANLIDQLPLEGRTCSPRWCLLPSATADTSDRRGLGLSSAGSAPRRELSAHGLEFNNSLRDRACRANRA